MALNDMTLNSPFENFFQRYLPAFYFEKFKTVDAEKIDALYANTEIIFDNIYQKIKEFPTQLDVYTAEAQYLYELGILLGIADITNLSKYLDEEGNVLTGIISQETFDVVLIRQRTYIANTLGRYLLKGTNESINRFFYSKGVEADVVELWTEDVLTGPFFEYTNALIIQYGDAISGSPSGDVYEDEAFDLLSEIQGG